MIVFGCNRQLISVKKFQISFVCHLSSTKQQTDVVRSSRARYFCSEVGGGQNGAKGGTCQVDRNATGKAATICKYVNHIKLNDNNAVVFITCRRRPQIAKTLVIKGLGLHFKLICQLIVGPVDEKLIN